MAAIEVRRLRKTYGPIVAVDDLSFDVERARCTRSSGRTAPASRRRSRSSKATVSAPPGGVGARHGPAEGGRELRDRIGIVLQSSGIERRALRRRGDRAVRVVLPASPRRRRGRSSWSASTSRPAQRIGTLSGGQRRRIDLALGIIGRPELLFLDEPTTGFDPAARRRSWELIETCAARARRCC